jgi:hypothetical protein
MTKFGFVVILAIQFHFLNSSYAQMKDSPTIEVMKLTVEKESEASVISNIEFELKISGLKNKFINAKDGQATKLTDEFGNDLIAQGKKIFDKKTAGGFYTSRQAGFAFQRYSEDSLTKAFKSTFISFALPAPGSKFIELTSVIKVVVEKPGKVREKLINDVAIKPDSSITVDGKSITFKQYGSTSVNEKSFFIYKIETDLAIVEISVVGLVYPEGLSHNYDEILIPADDSKMKIQIKMTDTQTVEIPIKKKIFLGI